MMTEQKFKRQEEQFKKLLSSTMKSLVPKKVTIIELGMPKLADGTDAVVIFEHDSLENNPTKPNQTYNKRN